MEEGLNITDKGTFIIHNDQDREIIAAYLYDLAHGTVLYKPEGLIATNTSGHAVPQETLRQDNTDEDYRRYINFVRS